jgi:lipid-binding SYLF domain-containing protein
MKKNRFRTMRSLMCAAFLGLVAVAGTSTPSRAEIGYLRVIFTKGGFIIGVGRGHGVLSFRGDQYPFKVSGMSIGATIGASTTELTGRARNLHSAGDIAGIYSTIGVGGALAAGAGGVALRNARGVILELHGAEIGLELSAAVGGVRITLQ